MPCCGGHGGGPRLPLPPPLAPSSVDVVGDALLNLSVLKTLSEHVDAATAVACYSVCRAWREAFGLSCLNSTLCISEPVDGTRSRFIANLHGAVTLEVTQPALHAQRGFDRHIAALSRNRHFLQLKVHLPVREAAEPQLALGALSTLQPLTQLTSLVISRNPAFTSAPHTLNEDDISGLNHLRCLTFLELCTSVPPPLGLSKLASLATNSLTQLRTLAFGHTSALWRIPQVAALCQLLDVCPLLTDLRLRCCAPPRDPKQLPDLMALSLPQRLTNFALTFARRLGRGEGGGGGAVAAAAAAVGDDDAETQYGEYEDMDEPWDSVDHLAPKPGLHVLIVEKGVRVTRMDVNVTVSVAASELPTVTMSSGSATRGRRAAGGRGRGRGAAAAAASGSRSGTASRRRLGQLPGAPDSNDSDDEEPGRGSGGAGGVDEEDVPPYDVTPMVLAEYERLLLQELGLTGTLAEPEDLHLGVRLDILEDEDEALAAAAAAAALNFDMQHLQAAVGPGGAGGQQVLHVAAQLQAALQAVHQHIQDHQLQAPQQGQGQGGAPGQGQGLLPALAAAANGPGGAALAAQFPPALAMLLNHMALLHVGGGGGAAGAGAGGNNAAGGGAGAAGGGAAAGAGTQAGGGAAAGGGGGAARGGGSSSLNARLIQLQLGPLSPHMCYLNLALVPMVTQLAMVAPGVGPNGEEVMQQPQPPADTQVAPVLLDVQGGGYTQLKSLAITGYVDQDCRPATWMSRGWLSRIPTGMPSLEYLALYDTLPAASNDPTAIEGLRALSRMEHLELRPLYLRFTGEVPCPLTVPPPVLPPKLLQLTLKKVSIPPSPPLPAGVTPGSAAALALLPDLPVLTHLWLFDCTAPDLLVFRRATRLEDLRLGGTTTTTALPDLLGCFPCLRGAILDCSHAAVPGWWSARQMSALAGLRCLRSLQLDAASLEPPPAASADVGASGTQNGAAAASRLTHGAAAAAAAAGAPAAAAAATASPQAFALATMSDSDDDSAAYLSTEEDTPVLHGNSGGGAGGAEGLGEGTQAEAGGAAQASQPDAAGGGAAAAAGTGGSSAGAGGSDLASVLAVLAGLTQLTDLTLSFDTPTLFYDPEEQDEEDGNGDEVADNEDDGDDDASSAGVVAAGGGGGGGGAGPSTASGGAKAQGGGGGGGSGGSEVGAERSHTERVYDAMLAGHSFAALGALQGLWRLRIGLPHGTVWEDVTDRLLPALRLAMPRTAVEMDVL